MQIGDNQATLADGQWSSADAQLRELLNRHVATLELPAHWPPADLELATARAAVEAFNGKILSMRRIPDGPSRMSDGRQIVF